jgi:hypothetical protein
MVLIDENHGVLCQGGDEVVDVDGFRIHAFKQTGLHTLKVVRPGNLEVLVVGGGGGGGNRFGGGGGGGGVLHRQSHAVSENVSVTVGNGGAGGPTNNTRGSSGANSVFGSLVANGGGGGASETVDALGGGSGGGGTYRSPHQVGGAGTSEQGFAGGNGSGSIEGNRNNAGGGGAGGPGVGGGNVRGDGGVGLAYSTSGTLTYYGGGGGAADNRTDTAGNGTAGFGLGGLGGGGAGGGTEGTGTGTSKSAFGEHGQPNTGGGGGGGAYLSSIFAGRAGGNGGSGIVLVRYPIPFRHVDGFNVHVFGVGTHTVDVAGAGEVEVLVVAGGGSGGGDVGGGGGAGGVIYKTAHVLSTSSISITVGNGGLGQLFSQGENGQNSTFDSLVAMGGGAGANYYSQPRTGGSGGGASGNVGGPTGATGTLNQGNTGGNATNTVLGAGGGGAGGVGQNNNPDTNRGGNGGIGILYSITGSYIHYAGGGGGAGWNNGIGGLGGGGDGGSRDALGARKHGKNGNPFTGGGGGGGGDAFALGGNGGSGIVIMRYRPALPSLTTPISFSSLNRFLGLPSNTTRPRSTLTGLFRGVSTNRSQLTLQSFRGRRGYETVGFVRAQGGEVTDVNGYRIHVFKDVGRQTFTVSNGGDVEVLVVAGGGGGPIGGASDDGGGGGAGGLIFKPNMVVSQGTISVIVGQGGELSKQGESSQFGSLIALGGGAGGEISASGRGQAGGSGGGSGHQGTGGGSAMQPIFASSGFGHPGGDGFNNINTEGSGGGGAGEPGQSASSASAQSGKGGDGLFFPQYVGVAGNPTGWFAGGGGGGGEGGVRAVGGMGGGGAGGHLSGTRIGAPGTPNTGGGGGGGDNTAGGKGGSGIVIVRYPLPSTGALDSLNLQTMPVAAFSVRRLFGSYGGPTLRIRRSTDNVEADVFTDAQGNITAIGDAGVTDLDAYLNGATAFVTTWYDQSGAGRHATNTTTTTQPILGKDEIEGWVVHFPSDFRRLEHTSISLSASTGYTCIYRVQARETNIRPVYYYHSGNINASGGIGMLAESKNDGTGWGTFANATGGIATADFPQPAHVWRVHSHTPSQLFENGVQKDIVSKGFSNPNNRPSGTLTHIGFRPDVDSLSFIGNISDMIIYTTNLTSAQRVGIEDHLLPKQNMGALDAVNIATPPATAFSLRRLLGSYSGPQFRVRRGSDNAEADVFTDATGKVVSIQGESTTDIQRWATGTGNFPILENPRFTSNTTVASDFNSVYGWNSDQWSVAVSSILDTTLDGWKAFNKTNIDSSDGWHSIHTSSPPHWIRIGYPTPVVLRSYSITSRNETPHSQGYPLAFTLQGSNDDMNWTDLEQRSGLSWSNDETKQFTVSSSVNGPYLFFRLFVTQSSHAWTVIGEWKLFTQTLPLAFVRTWYDQSGNNRHANQSIASRQPIFVSNALVFNGGQNLVTAQFSTTFIYPNTLSMLGSVNDTSITSYFYDGIISSNRQVIYRQNNVITLFTNENVNTTIPTPLANEYISTIFNSPNAQIYTNGQFVQSLTMATTNNSLTGLTLGSRFTNAEYLHGTMSELILHNAALSATDIASLNQIRMIPGALDSLNLTTMPAAAYSIRKLFRTYVGPQLRVRRSTDNAEADLYMDDAGQIMMIGGATTSDVNTWLNGATAFVQTWYDQSGEGRHINQITSSNQPGYSDTRRMLVFNNSTLSIGNIGLDIANVTAISTSSVTSFINAVNSTTTYVLASTATTTSGIHRFYIGYISGTSPSFATDSIHFSVGSPFTMSHVPFSKATPSVQSLTNDNGTVRCHVNGKIVDTTSRSTSGTITNMLIGQLPGDASGQFKGEIGDILLFNNAQNDTIISQVSNVLLNQINVTGALDTLSLPAAAAAYSLRRLFASYNGPAVRIRRSTDNVEADLYMDAGRNIISINGTSQTDLTAWLSGATAFVTTWYDQSGGQNHAIQTVLSQQPTFVNGEIVFDGVTQIFNSTGPANRMTKVNQKFSYIGRVFIDDTNSFVRQESLFGDWNARTVNGLNYLHHMGLRWGGSAGMHWNINGGWFRHEFKSDGTVYQNGWNTIVGVYDNSKPTNIEKISVHVNNSLTTNVNVGGGNDANVSNGFLLGDFVIGALRWPLLHDWKTVRGRMSELCLFYDTAFTQKDVSNISELLL